MREWMSVCFVCMWVCVIFDVYFFVLFFVLVEKHFDWQNGKTEKKKKQEGCPVYRNGFVFTLHRLGMWLCVYEFTFIDYILNLEMIPFLFLFLGPWQLFYVFILYFIVLFQSLVPITLYAFEHCIRVNVMVRYIYIYIYSNVWIRFTSMEHIFIVYD